MRAHWSLDDINWDEFDPEKVDPETLQAVKAAAMVEFNAEDYVAYLSNVFADDPHIIADIERWGAEEIQHGRALGRWAELADPNFNFDEAFARFRKGYRLPLEADASVRGSRTGEMIARCVVESGTSSYYSAIRDATDEPVLKSIAAHIAADEFRHYRLFLESFEKYQPREKPTFWERLRVALDRVEEAADDELAYAYYCANVPRADTDKVPYDRDLYSKEYNKRILRFYRPHHIKKAVAMMAKAVGLRPTGFVAKSAGRLLWLIMWIRARRLSAA